MNRPPASSILPTQLVPARGMPVTSTGRSRRALTRRASAPRWTISTPTIGAQTVPVAVKRAVAGRCEPGRAPTTRGPGEQVVDQILEALHGLGDVGCVLRRSRVPSIHYGSVEQLDETLLRLGEIDPPVGRQAPAEDHLVVVDVLAARAFARHDDRLLAEVAAEHDAAWATVGHNGRRGRRGVLHLGVPEVVRAIGARGA